MEQSPFVRITIEQLAKLVRELSRTEFEGPPTTPKAPANLTIGATQDNLLLPRNTQRWAIILSAAGSGLVSFSFGPAVNGINEGWVAGTGNAPMLFTFRDIGVAVTWEVKASGSIAGAVAGWQEFEVPYPLS